MLKILIPLILILTSFSYQAWAKENYQTRSTNPEFFKSLTPSTITVKVETVIDPLTFIGEDKKTYRLAGLDVPGLTEGGNAITDEATKKLNALLKDQTVKIWQTKNSNRGRVNRMNQQLVQAELEKDHIWIQGEMLAAGVARVVTQPDNPEMAREMLKLEDQARLGKKGLWADKTYQIQSPETVTGKENSFQIIEGEIRSVASVRNTTFLNFGPDWKRDFTIGIPSAMRTKLTRAGIDPQQLTRSDIRVRGWVQSYNGPYIELTHPEQLEILKSDAPMLEKMEMTPTASGPMGMQTIQLKPVEKPKAPQVEAPNIKAKANSQHANP